jgi:hypothetical protein
VNLVDEENIAGLKRRQQRSQVSRVLNCRAAREAQGPVSLFGDNHGQRCFPETWRAGQQNVIRSAASAFGRLQ